MATTARNWTLSYGQNAKRGGSTGLDQQSFRPKPSRYRSQSLLTASEVRSILASAAKIRRLRPFKKLSPVTWGRPGSWSDAILPLRICV